MEKKLFGGFIDISSQALDIRYARQGLIQSNIANLETPGYKVQELPFEKVMKSAMTKQGELAKTNEKHISPDPVDTGKSLEFKQEDRPPDIDEEMVKLSENQLMYELTTKLVGKKFEGLKYAIDEGGR
jgi:flagellar basal-body rod protein FlgB